MSNADDDGLDKAFEGFGEEIPETPAVEDAKQEEPAKEAEDAKTDDQPKEDTETPPTEEETPADPAEPPKANEEVPAVTEEAPEAPTVLTKGDVESVVSNLLNTERNSSRELEMTTQDVIEAYYPDGLSNVLIDERSGKKLQTPQDVVDITNGEMSIEEAAKWLMNEQYKLDQDVAKVKEDARKVAETTLTFKRDSTAVIQKYGPLFKKYPQLEEKVYDRLMKQVKVDKDKGVILSSPDVMDHYDFYLEPYQMAYEYSEQQSATAPVTPPEPPKPTAEDRMDETGDGGQSAQNDPNDFAQQVTKELAKGF